MNNYEARLARLEQQAGVGFHVVVVRRDAAGRYCVPTGGRTWVAEPDENEYAFVERVQSAVGSKCVTLYERDADA